MPSISIANDWPAETAGLRRLLLMAIPVGIAWVVLGGASWLFAGSVAYGTTAVLELGGVMALARAWRLGARGRLAPAASTMTMTILAFTILEAVVPPPTPGLVALPLIAGAIALQYLSGTQLRRHLLMCWATSVLVAFIVQVVPNDGSVPSWFNSFATIFAVAAAVGISMILLEQFGTKLRDSLARAERASNALTESEARHRHVVEELDEVVFRTDVAGRWTLLNPAWTRITGWPVEETLGRSLFETLHLDDQASLRGRFEALVGGRERCDEQVRLITDAGLVRWIELRARRATDASGRVLGISGSMIDITSRRRLEDQLTELAFHDPLTGLANRSLFHDRVEHTLAIRRRTPHSGAVVFLDLDGFKVVNDSLGHAAGDRLLVATARQLEACLRPGDTIARLGGDEFGVLLEQLGSEREAVQIVERLTQAVCQPVLIEGREIVATASAGIAMLDGSRATVEEVLSNADVAMYQAKAGRGPRFAVFEPEMHEAAIARLEDLAELRLALERHELFVEYQPIVDLGSGAMTAVEALVRWQHPQRGVLLPASFIPLAEESGLIVSLGDWVAREACSQAMAWQRQNPGRHRLSININVSAVQLTNPDLVPQMAAILDETGIDPSCLVFELTESAVMSDPDRAEERIKMLKALGVRVAIDDFGTGYSSLSYIQRFPVDILKLDRSFVSGLEQNTASAAMAELFIRLGRMLNVTTVAEGIETAGEAEILRGLNCHSAQGFHFSRPVSAEVIGALLRDGESWETLEPAAGGTELPRAS